MKNLLKLFAVFITFFFCAALIADNTDTTTTSTIPRTTDSKTPPNYTISITTPSDQDTLTTPSDTLNVSVNITPDLEADDTVTLYVDGSARGEPTHSTSISTRALDRGAHTLQAKITQVNGAGAQSQTITVYQQSHGLTSPIPNSRYVPTAPSVKAAPMAPAAPSLSPPIGPVRRNGQF